MRWIQRLLFMAGFVILGYCGAEWLNSRIQQSRGNRELDQLLRSRGKAPAARVNIPDGDLVGRVEIPELHLSDVIFQGTGAHVLDEGVGHLDTSALPGEPGNVVLAAHRDTFFRDLRNIRKGETVRVITPYGTRTYAVDSLQVVDPTEVDVMAPTPTPALTLITCYPFHYIGHAPKRFIVRALDTGYKATEIMGQREEPKASSEVVTARLDDEDRENLTYVFKASDEPQ